MASHNDLRLLHETRNTDDVFIRNVVAGVLSVLNNELTYTQVWSEDNIETVTVPFFYNLGSSDERVVQDNFMFFQDVCEWPTKIDGNFDKFPRGVITLNSSSIEASSICNRFVMGEYTKKEGDVYNTYVAYLYALPMKLEFNAEIFCDTHITMLKIDQAIRETLYKNKTFFVLYKGMKLRCRLGINDSNTLTAPVDHKMGSDYGDNSKPKLNFSFSVSTYHPVFDKSTEVRADSYMKTIPYDVIFKPRTSGFVIGDKNNDNKDYKPVNYVYNNKENNLLFTNETKTLEGKTLSSEQTITLEWDYFKGRGDMCSIIINAFDSETGEREQIASVNNNTFYDLKLSDIFESDLQSNFDIKIHNSRNIIIYAAPKLAIIPDKKTKQITEESFIILDKGYFLDPRDYQLDFSLEYKNKIYDGKLNIRDGVLSDIKPVEFKHKIKFFGELKSKNIALTIVDAEEPAAHDTIRNITIY